MKLNWKTFQLNRSTASGSSQSERAARCARRRTVPVAVWLALFTAASRPVQAEIYRYVDDDGVTVYSQSPPPVALGSGAESGSASGAAITITLDPGPSSAEAAAAHERLRQQMERDLDRRETQRRSAEETAERKAHANSRANACAAARGNLQTLQTLGTKRLKLPDGSSIRPSAEQRAQRMDEARQQIRELCD
jgi:hypothetical protein